jgi:hypothetical protein
LSSAFLSSMMQEKTSTACARYPWLFRKAVVMVCGAALTLILLPALAGQLPAETPPFAIDLTAHVGKVTKTAHAEVTALRPKAVARPVLEVKAGQRITVRWTLKRSAKSVVKDVLVHCFVVKEEAAGQAAVPKLNKGVAVESALTMDFKAGDQAEGDLSFLLDGPGPYLLRLETIGAAAAGDAQETFAALDMVVR